MTNRKQKFGIRKSSAFGAVSVVVGVLLLLTGQPTQPTTKISVAPVETNTTVVKELKPGNVDNKEQVEVNEQAQAEVALQENTVPRVEVAASTPLQEDLEAAENLIRNPLADVKVDVKAPVEKEEIREDLFEKSAPYTVGQLEEVVEYDNTKLNTYSTVKSEGSLKTLVDIYKRTVVNGKEVDRVLDRTEVLTEASPKVVVKGTIVETKEVENGEITAIAIPEVFEDDETLLVGETNVVSNGEEGSQQEVFDIVKHDGIEVSRDSRVVILKEAQPKVTKVGVKEIKVTSEEKVVVKEVEITEDEDMLVSAEPIITRQGQDGLNKITTTQTLIKGQVVDTKVDTEVLTEMVSMKKTVGVLEFKDRTETEVIPVETVYEKDTTMFEGEERLVEAGEAGEAKVAYTDKLIRGQVVESIKGESTTTKEMKPKRVATGSIVRTYERIPVESPITITTKEVENEDMLKTDAPRETFAGVEGILETTTVIEKWDGVEKGRTQETKVLKPMQQRIVQVGVKEIVVEKSEETVPVTDKIEYDESRLVGTPDVIVDGTPGTLDVTTTKTLIRGVVKNTQVDKVEKTPMVQRRVIKGSKVVTKDAETVTRTIKFVDAAGKDIKAPVVQTLKFNKTSWTNNSRVEWEANKTFEAITVPTFEKYETTETIPTLSVAHNAQDSTLTIRYTNKIATETKQVAYTVRFLEDLGNRFKVLKPNETQNFNQVTKRDMVTGQVVSTELVIDRSNFTYGYMGVTHEIDRVVEKHDFKQVDVMFRELNFTNKQVIDHVMAKSAEERYALAKLTIDPYAASNAYLSLELTAEDIAYLNTKLNRNLYQTEMLALVNKLRTENNLPTLQLKPLLDRGTQIRANEQAAEGYLRSIDENGDGRGDKAHTRPDGTDWTTAFEYAGSNLSLGENIGQGHSYHLERYISEKFLAEENYKQFYNSPGHRGNMLGEYYTHASFAFQVTPTHKLVSGLAKDGQSDIFVQVFEIE